MVKPVIVYPQKPRDIAAEKADAAARGFPTVNGKQALGFNLWQSPGGEKLTRYLLEDDTEVFTDKNGDAIPAKPFHGE